MGWHAEANRGEAGGDNEGDCGQLLDHKRQRAGPEAAGQAVGDVGPDGDQRMHHLDRGNVDDQRAGCGATFDSIDAGYGLGIQRVGAQAIHGFRWEGDETSGAEQAGGGGDLGL